MKVRVEIMSRLDNIKIKIGIAHPLEDALGYMEQVIRMKEEWPIDKIMTVRLILAELDKVMVELTNKTVNPRRLDLEAGVIEDGES
jgi:hypothetical protein